MEWVKWDKAFSTAEMGYEVAVYKLFSGFRRWIHYESCVGYLDDLQLMLTGYRRCVDDEGYYLEVLK